MSSQSSNPSSQMVSLRVARLIVVEPDENDYILFNTVAKEVAGLRVQVSWADHSGVGMKAIGRGNHDVCLIADAQEGGLTGTGMIRSLVAERVRGPYILLSRGALPEDDVAAFKAGAAAILDKDEITPRMLERTLRAVAYHQRALDRLEMSSQRDDLTGLLNRRGFFLATRLLSEEAGRLDKFLGVLAIHLHGMVAVEDEFGREGTKKIYKGMARTLSSTLRTDDAIARLDSGSRFAITAQVADEEQFQRLVGRLRIRLQEWLSRTAEGEGVSFSMGSACYDPDVPRHLMEVLSEAEGDMTDDPAKRRFSALGGFEERRGDGREPTSR
ncbi:MAG: GGDEF domain-containing protein [Sumerlaeia bacterium]